MFRKSFRRQFDRAGFAVLSCRNGDEALRSYRAGADFTALVTDSSGFEFANAARRAFGKLLVIRLSSNAESTIPDETGASISKEDPEWYRKLLSILGGKPATPADDLAPDGQSELELESMEANWRTTESLRYDPLVDDAPDRLAEYQGKVLVVAVYRREVVATAATLLEAEQRAKQDFPGELCQFVQGPASENVPEEELDQIPTLK